MRDTLFPKRPLLRAMRLGAVGLLLCALPSLHGFTPTIARRRLGARVLPRPSVAQDDLSDRERGLLEERLGEIAPPLPPATILTSGLSPRERGLLEEATCEATGVERWAWREASDVPRTAVDGAAWGRRRVMLLEGLDADEDAEVCCGRAATERKCARQGL